MQQYCKLTQTDDDFVDFSFDIINTKKKLFGSIILECAACNEGKNVGFCLEIKCNMRGITNNDFRTFHTYPKGMKLTYQKTYQMISFRAFHNYTVSGVQI